MLNFAFMNIEAEKLELIDWISNLKDHRLVQKILLLKKDAEKSDALPRREFGGGKHFFTYIAEDFNKPLDDFKEYME